MSSIVSDMATVTRITLVVKNIYVLLFYMCTPELITCIRSEFGKLRPQLVGYGFTPKFSTKEAFSISDVKYAIL